MELEPEMLATETIVPVYFAMEDDELLSIYTQTLTSSSSQGSLSAAEGRDLSPLVCIIHRNKAETWFKSFIQIAEIAYVEWAFCMTLKYMRLSALI